MTAQPRSPTPLPTESPAPPPTLGAPPRATLHASPAVVVGRIWDAFSDYVRRVWVNSSEDDIFFLAGGIAFNILLAALPFVLLVITGLVYALSLTPDASVVEVRALINRFIPPHTAATEEALTRILTDVIASRGALGIWGAMTFVWFSTRLFGSLRTVLAEIFDIETSRGIISGKWFDVQITVYATILLVVYFALSTYLALASSRGVSLLVDVGLREDVMGQVEYYVGRLIALALMVATFFALYKYLPNRRIRWQQALVGAISSGILLEIARNLWVVVTRSFDPGSLYTGTLYVIVSLVFWVYYAALLFIIGGEVSQAHELRRVRRLQRETLEG